MKRRRVWAYVWAATAVSVLIGCGVAYFITDTGILR